MMWLLGLVLVVAATGGFLPTPKELVFLPQPPTARYSFAHCFSGNEQPKDGWRTASCLVRNLCFNTTSKEFLFFTNSSSQHHLPAFTSQGTFNYKWSNEYDDTVKFRPRAVVGAIPPTAKFTPEHEVWLPYLPLAPTNIGHLVWDDYLAWFLLAKAAQVVLPEIRTMRPLWVNPARGKRAPWATCDWIRLHQGPGHTLPAEYATRCLKNNHKWLPFVLGPGQHQVLETNAWDREDELVCFANAALGMTPFANQGSGHHGWNPGDGVPPAFGRAPLLFEFTRHMMRLAGVATPVEPGKEIVVLFSSKSSDRIKLDFSPVVRELERTRGGLDSLLARQGYRLVVRHQVMYELSPKQQMELSSRTCVYLTAAGGGAFTAQFLPKGSALLLFQDSAAEHLHQGNVDWKVFNSASWLRTQFLHHRVATGNVSRVLELVAREVAKCVAFSQ